MQKDKFWFWQPRVLRDAGFVHPASCGLLDAINLFITEVETSIFARKLACILEHQTYPLASCATLPGFDANMSQAQSDREGGL